MSDIHNNNNRIGQQNVNSTVYNQYLGREVRRFLNMPPHYPDVFLGREEDLPKIKDLLFSANENILLLVNGEGGIGKTTVAARYFHTYWRDYQHLAWVFVEEGLVKSLLTLAVTLDIKFPQRELTEAEQLDFLLTTIANLNRPCLLVLDNANHLPDLERYYSALRRCTNLHLLLTSRITEFATAKSYRIQHLRKNYAVDLFKTHYPLLRTEEEPTLLSIFTAVGYNTLVIELLAKNLKVFNNRLKKRYRLADLLNDLQSKNLLTLSKSGEVRTQYQAPHLEMRKATPEAIIGAMYDLNELNQIEQKLLTIFAVLPAENIPYAHLEELVTDIADLDQHLLGLAQRGWLDFDEAGSDFKVSPVIQEVALQKVENIADSCDNLLFNLNEKLDYQPGVGHLINISYIEAKIYTNYAIAIIGSDTIVNDRLGILCERTGRFFSAIGSISIALQFFEKYRDLEEELFKTFPDNVSFKNGLAIAYEKLGETHSALGQLDKALQFFEKDAAISEQLFKDFPDNVSFKNGLAIAYAKLGETHSALGQLDKALQFFEDETVLFEQLFKDFPDNVSFKNGLAIAYEKLGSTHSALGQLHKALQFFENFFTLMEELFQALPDNVRFKNGLAIAYEKLGSTHSALGQLDKALLFFEDETVLFEQLFKDFPDNVRFKNGLAISYEKLGSTHSALGQLDKALQFFEEHSRIGEQLFKAFPDNVRFKNGLAISFWKLGNWHQQNEDLTKALDYFKKAEVLWQELATAFPNYREFTNNYNFIKNKITEVST